ncbi:MAG: hypothetical protein JSR09_02245 [Bacteroidetes bacterium]|nr:hypothetical protein [Bacteroidota bacterium]MBS1648504.1 hypothetical protein [Bacteroidota bacterium]
MKFYTFLILTFLCLASFAQTNKTTTSTKTTWQEVYSSAQEAFKNYEFDKSVALYKKAIELKPDERELYNRLLLVYRYKLRNAQETEAINYIETEIQSFGKLIAKYSKAALLYSTRSSLYAMISQYQLAINDLTKAISLDPKDSVFFYKRGTLYQNKLINKTDSAYADLSKAIALNFKAVDIFTSRAKIYDERKDYTNAINDYTEALKISIADKNDYGQIQILVMRAASYEAAGKYDFAIADYSKAIQINTEWAKAAGCYTKRTILLEKTGGFETASIAPDYSVKTISGVSQAYKTLLDDGYNYTYGYGSKKEVNLKKAIACSSEAIRLYPNVPDAYLNRARAYKKDGALITAKRDMEKVKLLDDSYTGLVDRTIAEWEGKPYTTQSNNNGQSPSTSKPTTPITPKVTTRVVCPACAGTGTVLKRVYAAYNSSSYKTIPVDCSSCGGKGYQEF